MGCGQGLERHGEEIEFAAHGQALGARGIDHGRHGGRAQAGRAVDQAQALAVHQLRRELAGHEAHLGQFGGQLLQLGRCLARIGHDDFGAAAHAPACHGQARGAQTQHEHALALQVLDLLAGPAGSHGRQHLFGFNRLFGGKGRDLGIGRVGDAGVRKDLGHEGRSILGCRQRGDVGHGLGQGHRHLRRLRHLGGRRLRLAVANWHGSR